MWRSERGLSHKDLHVTIGFRFADVHSVEKNHQTLIQASNNVRMYQFKTVVQSVLRHLAQAHRSKGDALELVIDMLLHHVAASQEEEEKGDVLKKRILALRAQCKLRSYQRRYAEVVTIADHILSLSSSSEEDGMIPVCALRALSLVQMGQYQQALPALEGTVELMEKKKKNQDKRSNLKRIELLRAIVQCRRYLNLSEPFCKFPRTEHLFDAGGKAVTRDDLLVRDLDFFLDGNKMIHVEEKVDGANVGFSLLPNGQILCQNRSHYVTASSQAQFEKLPLWLDQYGEALKTFWNQVDIFSLGSGATWCIHYITHTCLVFF